MNIKLMNAIFLSSLCIMLAAGVAVTIVRTLEKKEIVKICPDGTRIYQYPNGRFEAVGTGWGSTTETVPGPEICDK